MPNPRDFKTRAFFWQLWIGVPFLLYAITLGTSSCYAFFRVGPEAPPGNKLIEHSTGPFFYCQTAINSITNICYEYPKGCAVLRPDDAHLGSLTRCNVFNAFRGFIVISVVLAGLSWVVAIHYTFYYVKSFPSPLVSVILTLLQGVTGLVAFAIGETFRTNYYGAVPGAINLQYRYGAVFLIVNWLMAFIGAPIYLKFGKDKIDTSYNVNN